MGFDIINIMQYNIFFQRDVEGVHDQYSIVSSVQFNSHIMGASNAFLFLSNLYDEAKSRVE